MSEPTPIARAEALIRANPRERAAYDLGYRTGVAEILDDRHRKRETLAAAYLLLADVAPHPDAYTLAEMDALDAAARRVQAAVQALRYARKVREEASLRSFDDAEAQVQSAARELGRALGGGR